MNYAYMINRYFYTVTCICTDIYIYINTYISVIHLIYLPHETDVLGRYMLNLDIALWMDI